MIDKGTQTDTPIRCLLVHPFDIDIKKRLWLLPTTTFQEFQHYLIQKLKLQNENYSNLDITYNEVLIKDDGDLENIANTLAQSPCEEIRIYAHLNKINYKMQIYNLEEMKRKAKENNTPLKVVALKEKIKAIDILLKQESNSIDHRRRLEAFYSKISPQKIKRVDATLEKFINKEFKMWQQLDKKYKNELHEAGYQNAFSVGNEIKIKFSTDKPIGFEQEGNRVQKVNLESQAGIANIKPGWYIISINEQNISTVNQKQIKTLLLKAQKENPSMTITFTEDENHIPNSDVKDIVQKLDILTEQGRLAGGPKERMRISNAGGFVTTGKTCRYQDCESYRMTGFPYCQKHQDALSCGTFDPTKMLINKKPKASICLGRGPLLPPSALKMSQSCTMPADVSKHMTGKTQRAKIREEINSTEVKYVGNLGILMKSYVLPLKERVKNDSHFIDSNTYTDLVSNLEMISSFHQMFLPDLQEDPNVSAVILKYADYFKMYTHYMNGYDKCLKSLSKLRSNKKFSKFMDGVRKKLQEKGNLDLMSYLIMPVQRIPRYVLLLRELKKNTPEEHQHYEELGEAIEKVQEIASHINESKRKVENMSTLLRIQEKIHGLSDHLILFKQGRSFIKEGKMIEMKVSGVFSTMKESQRIFYLFNDTLLWTSGNTMKYKGHSSLGAIKLSWGSSDEGLSDLLCLSTSKTQIFFKSVNGKAETEKWKCDLDIAIEKDKKRRTEQRERRLDRSRKRASIKPGTSQTLSHSQIKMLKEKSAGLLELKEKSQLSARRDGNNRGSFSMGYSPRNSYSYSESPLSNQSGFSPSFSERESVLPHSSPEQPSSNSPRVKVRQVARRKLRSTKKTLKRPMLGNETGITESVDGNISIILPKQLKKQVTQPVLPQIPPPTSFRQSNTDPIKKSSDRSSSLSSQQS